jgi:hypothetical protein
MVAATDSATRAAAGAPSGRVFRLPGGVMPLVRNGGWRVVEGRSFEEAGRIVRVCPCRRGEDKGDKASTGKRGSLLRAFPQSFPPVARFTVERIAAAHFDRKRTARFRPAGNAFASPASKRARSPVSAGRDHRRVHSIACPRMTANLPPFFKLLVLPMRLVAISALSASAEGP